MQRFEIPTVTRLDFLLTGLHKSHLFEVVGGRARALLFTPSAGARERSEMSTLPSNPRSALDARTVLCFHIQGHWPGASESERSALFI